MKITLVQSRGLVNDPKVNFFKARMRINNVDSEIFVFPEMFCTGYVSQRQDMQLQVLENAILKDLAKLSDNKGSTIICGCPVAEGDDIYDTALIIDGFDRYC
jgi:predicted amidohydrolase